MPHQGRLPAKEKVRLVKAYLNGELGATWLHSAAHNRKYTPELKRQAVEEYLTGAASLRELCTKYHIGNKSMLQQWIKRYNGHGDFRRPNSGGAI